MTDIVERAKSIRAYLLNVSEDSLTEDFITMENTIESLRQQLEVASYWGPRWEKEHAENELLRQQLAEYEGLDASLVVRQMKALAECQAQEKMLRDALESAFGNEYWRPDNAPRVIIQSMQKALTLPSDSTALDTMLKQAKREALLAAVQHIRANGGLTYGLENMEKELE